MYHLHIILCDNSQIKEGDSTITFFQVGVYGNDDCIQLVVFLEQKQNQNQAVLRHIRNKWSNLYSSVYIRVMGSFFFRELEGIFCSYPLCFKTLIKRFLNLMDVSGSKCLMNCYHISSSLTSNALMWLGAC